MNAHEIDYHIYGEEMQYVEIELDPQEAVVAEAGSFMMMDQDIKMDTIFGDGSNQDTGVLGKLFSAGKRLLTGESLFMTAFLNIGQGKKKVSFASPYPGKIVPIDLSEKGGKFICQKDAFLCAAKGVSVGIEFSKRLGRGFFGGEGFIMQKLEGDGMAFVHAGGTMAKKTLAPGETLKVDTGCIVGFSQTVDYRRFAPMTYSINCLKDAELSSRVHACLRDKFPSVKVRADGGTVVVETKGSRRNKLKTAATIKEVVQPMEGVDYVEVHVLNKLFKKAPARSI